MTKVIDLFAGLGGFSEGAVLAGMTPVFAANHWPLACEYHGRNQGLVPKCQDVQQQDWREVPAHDGLLASPACQGHSRARGREKPHHDALRSTAWAVVACMEYHRERFGVAENVIDFLKWGLYPSWCDALQRLGYSVSPHIVDAADHGVPQNRERVFIVITRSRSPLVLNLPKVEHVPVEPYIEWDRHAWSPIDKPGRSSATLARIAAGRAKFGRRFVAPFYGSGSGTTGRSIHRPIGTLTTVDRWAVIDGDRMRVLQPSENLAIMSFKRDTILPAVKRDAMKLIGNAVAPIVARDLLRALERQL
jgi:DNA (cytosine-5)-methyltransferase 1